MPYEKDITERTKQFAIRIIKLSIELKNKNVENALRNQLLRSGTSVGANVREGKASSTKKELIRYYEIALRSAHETDYWIEVLQEGYNLKKDLMEKDKNELIEISKVLGAIILKLKLK